MAASMLLSSVAFAAETPRELSEQQVVTNQTTVLQNGENKQEAEQINVQTGGLDSELNLLARAKELIQAGVCPEDAIQNINTFAACMTSNGIAEDEVMEWGNQNRDVLELMEKYPYLASMNMTNAEAKDLLSATVTGAGLVGAVGAIDTAQFLNWLNSSEGFSFTYGTALKPNDLAEVAKTYANHADQWMNTFRQASSGAIDAEKTRELLWRASTERAELQHDWIRVWVRGGASNLSFQHSVNDLAEITNQVGEAFRQTPKEATQTLARVSSDLASDYYSFGENLTSMQKNIQVAAQEAEAVGNTAESLASEARAVAGDYADEAAEGVGIWAMTKAAAKQAIDFIVSPAMATGIVVGACAGAALTRYGQTHTEYEEDPKKFMQNRMEEIELNDGID